MWGLKICQAPARLLARPPWCLTNQNFQGQGLEYQTLSPVCITEMHFCRLKGCICHCLPENSLTGSSKPNMSGLQRAHAYTSVCFYIFLVLDVHIWFHFSHGGCFMYSLTRPKFLLLSATFYHGTTTFFSPLNIYLPGINFIWRGCNICFITALVAF